MDERDTYDPQREAPGDDPLADTAADPAPTGVETAGTTQTLGGTGETTGEPRTGPTGEGDASTGGMPGDGVGRRDEIGGATGVHPFGSTKVGDDMPVRTGAEWGQGDRGSAGYEDEGTSEGSPKGTVDELEEG